MDVEKAAEAAQGRCLSCGYTKEDAQFHMDHYLCRNYGKAPWELAAPTAHPASPEPEKPCSECNGEGGRKESRSRIWQRGF